MALDGAALTNLVVLSPSAWHLSDELRAWMGICAKGLVTPSFELLLFQRDDGRADTPIGPP